MRLSGTIAVMVAAAGISHAAERLPTLNVDLAKSSVSGLSSGAYMAGQFNVAFSSTLVGVGIVAGGPYDCAEGALVLALSRCTRTDTGAPDAGHLLEVARNLAAQGEIDPLSGLSGQRVYVFSGRRDETVLPAVAAQAVAFYRLAGVPEAHIRYVQDLPAGHGFVTLDQGIPCGETASPFINDCDYDQAGDILRHIYGELSPPAASLSGELVAFDQSEFLPDPATHGMDETGFVYISAACAAGERCRVHIAFHGCKQTVARIGDRFLTWAGYDRWADANNLVVLYPQAHETPTNPNACWDWWGYDDPDYMTKAGRQMAAVRAMLDRLVGASAPSCETYAAYNYGHWQAGRAHVCAYWYLCANGSDDALGLWFNFSTLYESPKGYFGTSPCH